MVGFNGKAIEMIAGMIYIDIVRNFPEDAPI
jgi:hypothetical protein